jgi:hypothetical protein
MTTAAVTMVKDEADIIGATVAHMLTQVDYVMVADNMSTDNTRRILNELKHSSNGRLMIVDDTDPAYEQSRKMTDLAHQAHRFWRADWIVPFDADEIWYSPHHDRIADALNELAPQWLTVGAALYDHVASRFDDLDDQDPTARIGWRRVKPLGLPKVAGRWHQFMTIEMGNHGVTYPGGTTVHDTSLVIRHFPYRSVEQLVRKVRNGAAAYKAAHLPETFGAHWRQWGQLLEQSGPDAIEDLFHEWYWSEEPYEDAERGELIFDPAPVRR